MSPVSPPQQRAAGRAGERRKVTFTFRGGATLAEQPVFPWAEEGRA